MLKKLVFYLGVVDYNATAIYMKSISPIWTGIEGRIKFKTDRDEKSNTSNRHTKNVGLLLIALSILLFLNFII